MAYLEAITGPAFSSDGGVNTYKVDGCSVVVGTSGGKIQNVGIDHYSDRCSFDIGQYFAGGYSSVIPRNPTYAQITTNLDGEYIADCLASCGNAADPVVSMNYSGSHADSFHQISASTSIGEGAPLTAYEKWADALEGKFGDDYVANDKYKCGESMQDVAGSAFGSLHPDEIRVGDFVFENTKCKADGTPS